MNRLNWLLAVAIVAGSTFPFSTCAQIPDGARMVQVAKSTRVATWKNNDRYQYAIDGGSGEWRIVEDVSYQLRLRYASFDPLQGVPVVPALFQVNLNPLPGDDVTNQLVEQVYIVQFTTQPLEEYRAALRTIGAEFYKYLPHHAYLVRLDPAERDQVAALPFVRWVGVYHPAYKLDDSLLADLEQTGIQTAARRLNIMVHQRGPLQKNFVATRIAAVGGTVDSLIPDGYRMEATLNGEQLLAVAALPEVQWIDPWTEPEVDMDLAREIGGANQIEAIAGFAGQGVRGEVMDGNLFASHVDFQAIPPVFHGPRAGGDDHGTGTYGIVFADGTGDPEGRGMLPLAQGIFADFGQLNNRYAHTAELVQAPYFGVFQSNSWGNGPTLAYTSISAEMDDIIFINDLLITQSQSNQDSQLSRPQAWAKNIVAVGGINHQETVDRDDDFWSGSSIGPAADGRIKPDLCHFYDTIYTTDDQTSGYRNFCCTSGATPIVAGHFGLFFQMWSEGIFGNAVNPTGTVFENRPRSTTARAMVINQASAYSFSGTNDNLTRTHQGWGMPDVARLYEARNRVFVVNEQFVLENLDTVSFDLNVNASTPEFRATLVYMDPMGSPSASIHRINDLTLRVTSPDGTTYWGNNGLLSGNWSTAGGNPNTIDPVENVFVQDPTAGTWTVEVIAAEINEDAHSETVEVDADFALVVSGINQVTATLDSFAINDGTLASGDLPEVILSDDQYLQVNAASEFDQTPVAIEFTGTLSSSTPHSMSVVLEAQVNTVGLGQRIEMFNYFTEQFEQIDESLASFATDTVVNVNVPDDIGDYVEDGTGRVKTRVSWFANAPTLLFPWEISIDQFTWNVN